MNSNYTPVLPLEDIAEIAKDFSVNNILKHNAYQNKPLDFDTAYMLGVFTLAAYTPELNVFDMDPAVIERQSIAALCSLHNRETYQKDEASHQIAGITAAVFDYDIATSENGFLKPDVNLVMDNCGMGGDLFRTPNVSTLAALIASSDGVNFGKHGSPGNTDSTGSSDFLEYCGLNLFPDKETTIKSIEELHFGYVDAIDTRYKRIHVQTHQTAKLAHMNDIIGPVTNPVDTELVTKRVVGVNHLIPTHVVADAYRILNNYGVTHLERGLFVRGFVNTDRKGGIDEVSTFEGGTLISELRGDKIGDYQLFAEDFGLERSRYFEPPKGKRGKAQFSKQILMGKHSGAPQDLILANAAILFYLSENKNKQDLPDCTERARNALENAFIHMGQIIEFNNGNE